jgi:hypothetical protein
MKTLTRSLALGGLLLAAAGATAGVSVNYIHPEGFVDLPFVPYERERVLEAMTLHFTELGKQLPAGEQLKVEVLDIDLAGSLEHGMRGNDIRILKGAADWPRLRLRYTLEANGQLLRSAEDSLSDMDYMRRHNRYDRGDLLRYEKSMIDDWFKRAIIAPRPG